MAAFRSPIQAVIVAREVLEPLGATLTMGGDHRRGVINVSTFGRLYPITVSVIPGTTRPSPARTEAVVRGLLRAGSKCLRTWRPRRARQITPWADARC